VFAYACAKIAQSKGYNAILFGVLGYFFSIIVLIVVLALPDRRKAREVTLPSGRSEQDVHADS
jgi:hypothetical protein